MRREDDRVASIEGREPVIGIGELALLTGLSVTRLRRYHDLGLLEPARVDPTSGYRSYSPEQVGIGRQINQLRQIDLPLEDVERVMIGREPATAALHRHRRRLTERLATTT